MHIINYRFYLPLFSALTFASCATNSLRDETVTKHKSGEKTHNVNEYSLTRNATGIVEKHYAGGWNPRSVARGDGSVLRIFESCFTIGSFDGSSHSEILIQLPDNLEIGKQYTLVAAYETRVTHTDDFANILGRMKDREVVAYKFSNPLSGELKKVKLAWVKVLSLGAKTAEIQLRLKADLESDPDCGEPVFTFDIDKRYTVGIAPEPKR